MFSVPSANGIVINGIAQPDPPVGPGENVMLKRLETQCLLRPDAVAPSAPGLSVVGVFNPGAARLHGEVYLLARVAEQPADVPAGQVALPRFENGAVTWDLEPAAAWDQTDPRVAVHRETGVARLTSVSHLRSYRLAGGRADATETGRFVPAGPLESYGIEDPRITVLDGELCVTYVGVSAHGVSTLLATTRDLDTFERRGVIFPVENKDVVLFPERTGGRYRALHRPVPSIGLCGPQMWLADSPDLLAWGNHRPLYGGAAPWEGGRVGAGPPPVRVEDGWLVLYHAATPPGTGTPFGRYVAGALLLDADPPHAIRKRAPEPLFAPELPFEREGFVPEVVFPTGMVEDNETFLVYYGAADNALGVVVWERRALLAALRSC